MFSIGLNAKKFSIQIRQDIADESEGLREEGNKIMMNQRDNSDTGLVCGTKFCIMEGYNKVGEGSVDEICKRL